MIKIIGSGPGSRYVATASGLLLIALALVTGCARPPAGEAIATVLEAMSEAIERGEVGGLMTHIADDFGTVDGALDRAGARRMAVAHTRLNSNIGITMTGLEIQVDEARATAKFRTLVTGGNRRFIPERGRLYDVTVGFREQGGDWQVINADWAPVFDG